MTPAAWVRSALFRSYTGQFVWLWLLAKGANVAGAAVAGLPLFAFQPIHEALACGFELFALSAFIRRTNEDILLANLGLTLGSALAPLVLVHVALSLALAVVA